MIKNVGYEGKLGAHAIKHTAEGAHLRTPWLLSLQTPSLLPPVQAPGTRFYTGGVGRALWVNSGEGLAQCAFPVNWAT